jgi:hypothetical protein
MLKKRTCDPLLKTYLLGILYNPVTLFNYFILSKKGGKMRKTIHIILIMVFSLSILFIGTGCNTAELEDLTKKIEEVTTEIEGTTAKLQGKENEVQDLQGKLSQLESELSALKAAKNLIAFIVGEDGAPLSGAKVIHTETGEEAAVGDSGTVSWMNLADDSASLSVNAQGYFPKEESIALQEGTNGVLISMQRDPFGLLPSEAFIEGETLLYLEDFQDGMAQGWPEIENGEQGYNVGPEPGEEGNTIISLTGKAIDGGEIRLSSYLEDHIFGNSVWRIKVKYTGKVGGMLNWQKTVPQDKRYFSNFGPHFAENVPIHLVRYEQPGPGHVNVDKSGTRLSANLWYTFEVSVFEGLTEVWVDGQKIVSYDDPEPLPEGTIGLECGFWSDSEGTFYYDDLSVSELSAPFVSIFGVEE